MFIVIFYKNVKIVFLLNIIFRKSYSLYYFKIIKIYFVLLYYLTIYYENNLFNVTNQNLQLPIKPFLTPQHVTGLVSVIF